MWTSLNAERDECDAHWKKLQKNSKKHLKSQDANRAKPAATFFADKLTTKRVNHLMINKAIERHEVIDPARPASILFIIFIRVVYTT